MRVHVVSDVHGAAGPLHRAADGADALLCLGDLLLFVDYADHGQGIFAELFGAEAARRFVALRTAKQFDEARAMSAGLWQRLGGDPAQHIRDAASRQYTELFAALRAVDVLCAHIPPAIPQLLYDTVARRVERGSEALLGHIRRTQPRYVLFGHVHQPLARRVRIGRSECINVGHFRATGAPYVLEL